jgi:hypothetical protein
MATTNQLRKLLGDASGKISEDCLRLLEMESNVETVVTDAIPVGELLCIYELRAKLNALSGNKIQGFDELLLSLASVAKDLGALVHMLTFANERMVVFTDVGVSVIFGILRMPKKRDEEDEFMTIP